MRWHINVLEVFSEVNEKVPNSYAVRVKVKALLCIVCLEEPS